MVRKEIVCAIGQGHLMAFLLVAQQFTFQIQIHLLKRKSEHTGAERHYACQTKENNTTMKHTELTIRRHRHKLTYLLAYLLTYRHTV